MKNIYLFLWTLICFACDPGVSFDERIINNSSRKIGVRLIYAAGSGIDSLTLNPGECKCENKSHLGRYDDYKDSFVPCDGRTYSLFLLDSTAKITKDINNCDNWEKSSERMKGKGGSFFCKFELTDADIK